MRGKKGRLLARAGVVPPGQTVTIRALATIGREVEYRVVGLGSEASVPAAELELID